jgi:hypothetical protein
LVVLGASEFTGPNAFGLGKRTNTEAARHFAGFLVGFLGAQDREDSRSRGFRWFGLGKEAEEIRRSWTQCEGNGTNWDVERGREIEGVKEEGDELGPNLEGRGGLHMPTRQRQNYEAVR